ncbi:ABC transporter substrate-binding protein [Streptomyces sp. NPDC020965]|uniref:ABC transporter substrate-binding protein n=1 Tax=Streptomyces sp. NPDC020965 TaxID=3365105 RepID=UPI0037A388BD
MALTFLTDHTSPLMRDLADRIVAGWNERHPGTPVTLSVLDHEELRDRLGTCHTDPSPPDVMTWFAGNRMRSLVDQGLMLDISAMWKAERFGETFLPRFRSMEGGMGPSCFLPTSHYWWGVYYRPSVFESLGITTPIGTWDELMAACGTLRNAGIAPFSLGARFRCAAAAWFDYLNMRINGPDFHRELMELRVPYTDERVRRVFDFWRPLVEGGYFLGEPAEYDEEEAVAAVLRGEAGMTLVGAYATDEYTPPGEPDIDFFRFPIIDPSLPIGEDTPVDGYFVAGNSASPEDATAFLAYLGSHEVQQLTIEHLATLPTRTDVDVDRGGRHVAKGMEILRGADRLEQFYDLDTSWELSNVGMTAFVSFLRDPSRADELLREIEAVRREQLAATPAADPD